MDDNNAHILEEIIRLVRPILPYVSNPLPRSAKYDITDWSDKDTLMGITLTDLVTFANGVVLLDCVNVMETDENGKGIVSSERLLLSDRGELIHQSISGGYSLENKTMEIFQYGDTKTLTVDKAIKHIKQACHVDPFPVHLLIQQTTRMLEREANRHPKEARSIRNRAGRIENLMKR